MQLEFHRLDRRWEHLRARRPHRQRRLMASLAESGQQTPIVVVLCPDHRDRYPDCIRERILCDVAMSVKKPRYLVWSDPSSSEIYRQLLRQSLFFGLSDGARIDTFRRATTGIVSNEQVLLATEIAPGKWDQVVLARMRGLRC
jgi:hypothetical protein